MQDDLSLAEQDVVDKKNAIMKNGYLTPTDIVNIKRGVEQKLTAEAEQ